MTVRQSYDSSWESIASRHPANLGRGFVKELQRFGAGEWLRDFSQALLKQPFSYQEVYPDKGSIVCHRERVLSDYC